MAKLSESELAALDLLIAMKKENAAFITNIINVTQKAIAVTQKVAQVAQVTTALVAAAGGSKTSGGTTGSLADQDEISLDDLLEIRRNAR